MGGRVWRATVVDARPTMVDRTTACEPRSIAFGIIPIDPFD